VRHLADRRQSYTRSSNARKGAKSQILDTKHDISHEYTKTIKASDEGVYEIVAIKDKYCSFSTHNNAQAVGNRRALQG
jgi:nucleoporin POM152